MSALRRGLPPSILLAAWFALPASPEPGLFEQVRPIFQARCFACHGEALQTNGLRLDRREDALRGGYSGPVIRPGDSAASKLYQLITAGIGSGGNRIAMPPSGHLSLRETELIRAWIDQGAVWPSAGPQAPDPHARPRPWSFQPIRPPSVPPVQRTAWVRTPVDSFILSRLEAEGIAPSAEAPKSALVRRLYLDLTGLPPTPDEAAAFLIDPRPDAYELLVEHLLQSPHYGEKWARPWLDLARYADSEGGVQDYVRPYAWRYRQWVIDALNRDMPFDEFTVEQLAGDLLPGATLQQKIATGFERNTVTSREGGIDLEKLRYDQLVDRVDTVGTAWLGLTIGCAQCHDHKYDPLSQRDFFRLMAFFENSSEVDLDAPLPGEWGPYLQSVAAYRAERRKLLDEYRTAPLQTEWEDGLRFASAHPGKRTDWDAAYDAFSKLVDNGPAILHKPVAARTTRERERMEDMLARSSSGILGKKRYEDLKLKTLSDKLAALEEKYPPLSQVMTLSEASVRQPTFIRLRGNYKDKGVAVTPGVPQALPALPPGPEPNRLDLARWLVSPANPLTARVAVNRIWQELFGTGLVRTSEDFGTQGEPPSHPELLDWMAARFRDGGWSRKSIIRLIVLSSTYRQSSAARPDLTSRDPSNLLLARQSRFRLPAELIRDSALQASGLLWDAVGGESVRPPQPEGVADLSYSIKWVESTGRSRYRRGLYVHIQRTAAYPLLMNFDAPDRTVTCARREISNTPLQALNLMNDPVFTEAAEALAARVLKEASTETARIERAFQLCYARDPNSRERDLFSTWLERRRQLVRANPPSAQAAPLSDLAGVDAAEAGAWFGAGRALLNSDEFLTRE